MIRLRINKNADLSLIGGDVKFEIEIEKCLSQNLSLIIKKHFGFLTDFPTNSLPLRPRFLKRKIEVKKLPEYSIPFQGLKQGKHLFNFQVNRDFFGSFEEALLEDGDVELEVAFEKRPGMFVLDFFFEGTIKVNCDLCAEERDFPIEGNEQLLVKFSEEGGEEEQVMYLLPGETELNIAQHTYEFICLSVPMRRVPCANEEEEPTCDSNVLDYLSSEKTEPEEEIINPIWAELKKKL